MIRYFLQSSLNLTNFKLIFYNLHQKTHVSMLNEFLKYYLKKVKPLTCKRYINNKV